jgi:NADPH:quinone reductase-like Zn-dependent oxidoreductase
MSNRVAVLPSAHSPLVVETWERPHPQKGEVLVRVHAVATNPVDWKIQKYGIFIKNYPTVLASDVAGTVEEVGEQHSGETNYLQKGDRVWSWTPTLSTGDNRFGGFQEYVIFKTAASGRIPANLSFEEAAGLGLGPATAITGLYVYNKVPRPSTVTRPAVSPDAAVLYVTGGASAVGSAVVQLGALSGLRVIATASPKNFELVKSFGASQVLDYRDHELVPKVRAAIGEGKHVSWAFDAISEPSTFDSTIQILGGQGNLIIVLPLPVDHSFDLTGIKLQSILAFVLYEPENAEVLGWFVNYISSAAESGSFVPLKPHVVGHSIDDAQKILDFHASGQVSAVKPVLKLV